MADASSRLTPEPRPLLAFPAPSLRPIPTDPDHRPGRPPQPRRPGRDRQHERLTPQFQALREALGAGTAVLGDAAAASDPELIVVFEVAGTVDRFARAVRDIEGLDFLTEFVGEGIEPDDEFFMVDEHGDPIDAPVTQSLYLVMTNVRAIDEMVRLFDMYHDDPDIRFDTGLAPLKGLFNELHTVRRWGPEDRVQETGLLDDWREDLAVVGSSGSVRVEIELVWKATPETRAAAQHRVETILNGIQDAVVRSVAVIESINYHALLAELPMAEVATVLASGPDAIDLLRANEVLFVSPARPMTVRLSDGAGGRAISTDATLPSGSPRAALLDGLPLANHDVLVDRLLIDDPEDRGALYTPPQCGHGTAMASLIIHGDLNEPGAALRSPLYVQPVLQPHDFYDDQETTPPDRLFIDVIHTAFQHMLGEPDPAAPSVRIVNLSLGEPARTFVRRLSPLARLVDYLSYTHNCLVVVSAGNHPAVVPAVPVAVIDEPAHLDGEVRSSLHRMARLRRLLAPAEAINALTVGAVHADSATNINLPDTVLDPLAVGAVAAYSAQGFGFKRAPKPEIHAPGGRSLSIRPVDTAEQVALEPAQTAATGPGLLVAAPTPPGSTDGVLFAHGTSNAAALTTRSAAQLLDVLESLVAEDGDPSFPDPEFHPVLIKALLVHATQWPDSVDEWATHLGATPQTRRRLLTQHLGFGVLDNTRLGTATASRACLVGAATIKNNKRQSFRMPLPPSLSSPTGWRRLTVTLAWLTPTVPNSQRYRVAQLLFGSPRQLLRVAPTQADHTVNGNGTVLHEVLEGTRAAGYTPDDVLSIDVDCRVRVGRLSEPVRFALVATLEVGSDIAIDVHQEIRERLREEVREQARIRPTS